MADLLIADDDPDFVDALATILAAYGHEVRTAHNGEEALKLIDQKLPELVLLDVEMPVLDGPSTAYRMLVADMGRENIPIIFMSGVVDLHLVAAKVGTPYYLGKPCKLEALIALVDRALVERRPPRATSLLPYDETPLRSR